jgi:hypothetical protein
MELPIPTHLQPYLSLVGEENDEYAVTGKVHCSCDCEKFKFVELLIFKYK